MTETCHECGGTAVLTRAPKNVQTPNGTVTVEAEFMRCEACGEEFYLPGQMDALQRAATELVRKQEGLLSPAEIEAIRAEYGLSQAAFETLIHAGPKTVTRWERGTVAPNGTADTLLRILRDRPDVVASLAKERGVPVRATKPGRRAPDRPAA
jgi:HTH-type transcriptional regulator/antitoxin MqsA